ncbi:MAG: hypothetical protein EA417_10085 [Gammaproteobacteria bacterium]|nr:MAG: hypothetical protein EA417_10085 [Gammaproteobacteria bacterium]
MDAFAVPGRREQAANLVAGVVGTVLGGDDAITVVSAVAQQVVEGSVGPNDRVAAGSPVGVQDDDDVLDALADGGKQCGRQLGVGVQEGCFGRCLLGDGDVSAAVKPDSI